MAIMKNYHKFLPLAISFAATVATASAADIPYHVDFYHNATLAKDCANKCETWTPYDANNDACGWQHYVGSYNDAHWLNKMFSSKTESNDYLYSPTFTLEGGTQYQVELWIYANESAAKKRPMEILLCTGSATTPASSDVKLGDLKPEADWSTSKDRTKYGQTDLLPLQGVTFTAPASGTYRLALHSYGQKSDIGYGELRFKEFSLTALQKATAPGAVSDLTVTPGQNAALSATISLTTPALNAENAALSGNVTIKAFRGTSDTPFHTSASLEPGKPYTITDNEAPAGMTTYTVLAENTAGPGAPATASAWIGEDITSAPTALTATLTDGKIKLNWIAPVSAQHGGFVDYAALNYDVKQYIGDEAKLLPRVKGTELTVSDLDLSKQINVRYEVTPVSRGGAGESAVSPTINCGLSLQLPFAESFANCNYATSPWRQEVAEADPMSSIMPAWDLIEKREGTNYDPDDEELEIPFSITSQDADKGFAHFNSESAGRAGKEATGRLIFPALDFSKMLNPVLTFYVHQNNYDVIDPTTAPAGMAHDNFVTVEGSVDNGAFTPVEGFEFHTYSDKPGWVLCEVPLYQFAGKGRVQVALLGHGTGGGATYVDNLRIEERTAYDLQALSISAPARVRIGDKATIAMTYKNAGGFTMNDYKVKLLKDGVVIASEYGVEVAPGRTAVHRFTFEPAANTEGKAKLQARIVCNSDQETGNNDTDEFEITVTSPLLPGVGTITGEANDLGLTLKWMKPSYIEPEALIEEDGFENYDPFTIDSFGDFTSFDNDGRITWGLNGVVYDNKCEKMAYQVFAPAFINGLDPEEIKKFWHTHSGTTMLLSPQAMNGADPAASDDWLVFPPLSGNQQQISFWARSVREGYNESMQAFYSMSASASQPDDYQGCPDGGDINYSVGSEWKKYSYSVPAGAKRFALRHTSQDGLAFLVDDVTYQRAVPDAAELGLLGFNVYCDDHKVNKEVIPAKERSYQFEPEAGEHNYTVTAVYPDGESSKSGAYVHKTVGISAVDAAGVAVYANGGDIFVAGAQDMHVSVYNASGLMKASLDAGADLISIPMDAQGVYIVSVESRRFKVVVR